MQTISFRKSNSFKVWIFWISILNFRGCNSSWNLNRKSGRYHKSKQILERNYLSFPRQASFSVSIDECFFSSIYQGYESSSDLTNDPNDRLKPQFGHPKPQGFIFETLHEHPPQKWGPQHLNHNFPSLGSSPRGSFTMNHMDLPHKGKVQAPHPRVTLIFPKGTAFFLMASC